MPKTIPSPSTHFIEETNNKLDLFLPEYIRQRISDANLISETTSSDIIRKKKPRPKMLNKDCEAKSLLTNEFDHNTVNNKQAIPQRTISTDDETIHDDDEFIINTVHSDIPTKSDTSSLDNILSRGFFLWLQESQALSQQNIVIQPTQTNAKTQVPQTIKSTSMTNSGTEKRIHMANAYAINHPGSIPTPAGLTSQSNGNTFQDDSNNEEDSTKKQNSYETDKIIDKRQSNSNNTNYQQSNINTDDVQRRLGGAFYQQVNNNSNHSINFDDWAHFHELKNDLSPSFECFYTQSFDEDTLLSDTTPIHHPGQRYGDFLSSDDDILLPQSTIQFPSHKYKPSEYFKNRRKQEPTSEQCPSDDEIFISHSNNGLSRHVKP